MLILLLCRVIAMRSAAQRGSYTGAVVVCIVHDSCHRLRIRILRILKFPKIHEFLGILKLSILKIHGIQIITLIASKFEQTP